MMHRKTRSLLFGALLAAGLAAPALAANDASQAAAQADDQAATANIAATTPGASDTYRAPSGAYVTPGSAQDFDNARRTRDARMAECSKQMPSNRETCMMQAQAEYDHTITALRGYNDFSRTAAVQNIERAYSDRLAWCARQIDSSKDVCRANAQAERSRAMTELAASTTDAGVAAAARQRYDDAIRECQLLPASEREVCLANVGSPRALPSQG